MLSTASVVDRSLALVAVLTFAAGCFGGSQEFASSTAAPEPGQPAVAGANSGHVPSDADAAHVAAAKGSDAHGAVHWSYKGPAGPSYWGGISADYAVCRDGLRQSPIDLVSARPRDLSSIDFSYQSSNLSIVNNGHTIQVDHYGDSYISIGRWPYRLRQFHFHSPSEHTIDGEYAEIEMHLVHQDEQNRLAVVGIMIQPGAHNPAFDDVWHNLPAEPGQAKIVVGAFVDPGSLLPADRNYFQYSGSLTTPPCSEGVSWFVMATPITMSPEQIARFQEVFAGNNRPVQDRKGRALYSTYNQ